MASSYVIAVMGTTGAGKSLFIKLVTGDQSIKIGHGLEAETSKVTGYDVWIQGKKYVLVDTPGFDDTYLSDTDILKMLSEWLASSYRAGTKLNAILYVHPITQTRMQGSALRNLAMFKQLCGEGFYNKITLGISQWVLVDETTGNQREQELKSNVKFWKPMIARGSKVRRLPQTSSAAKDIVVGITNTTAASLKVQRQMVDEGVLFDQLAATRALNAELEEQKKKHETELRKLKEEQRVCEEQEREKRIRVQQESQKAAKAARIEHHAGVRQWCARKKIFGSCDKCKAWLKDYDNVYHCCSCRKDDDYWQCSSCGNDCGKAEHPYMTQIDNSSICRIM